MLRPFERPGEECGKVRPHQGPAVLDVSGLERADKSVMLIHAAGLPSRSAVQPHHERTTADDLSHIAQEQGAARHLSEDEVELRRQADIFRLLLRMSVTLARNAMLEPLQLLAA